MYRKITSVLIVYTVNFVHDIEFVGVSGNITERSVAVVEAGDVITSNTVGCTIRRVYISGPTVVYTMSEPCIQAG